MDSVDSTPPRILLADDEIRTARLLCRLLEEDGFEVELTHDGASAIARLALDPVPDLLITDLRMPHAGGVAVARYARTRAPGLPIFFLTGYPELVPSKLTEFGVAPVVHTKPVDYAALYRDLCAALGTRKIGRPPTRPPPART